jgi:hypothetical protein
MANIPSTSTLRRRTLFRTAKQRRVGKMSVPDVGVLTSEQSRTDTPVTKIGDRVRSSSVSLLLYLVLGIGLTGACVVAGMWTAAASPADGCSGRAPGIVALEFAGEKRAADAIVDRWRECPGDAAKDARGSLRRDTVAFVPLYVVTLAWWVTYVHWSAYRDTTRRVLRWVLVAIAGAGVLDLIENAALYRVVGGDSRLEAIVATTATVPKWAILVVAAPLALVGMVSALVRFGERMLKGEAAQPQFFGPRPDDEPSILAPLEPTDDEADRRQRRACDPYGDPWPAGRTGICLSGGGIRSASFALGAIQALQTRGPSGEPSVYESAAYLATVSGGGYVGTATQVLAHQEPEGALPLHEASPEAALLRRKRRYLWGAPRRPHVGQSTREFVTGMALFLSGIVFNMAIVVACIYVVAHPLGWFARSTVFAGEGLPEPPIRQLSPGLVAGTILAVMALYLLRTPLLARASSRRVWTGALLGLVEVAVVGVALLVVLTSGFSAHAWYAVPLAAGVAGLLARIPGRLRRRRSAGKAAAAEGPLWASGLALFILGLAVTSAWYWVHAGFVLGDEDVTGQWAVSVLAGAVGIVAAIFVGAAARIPIDYLRRRSSPFGSMCFMGGGIFLTLVFAGLAVAGVLKALDSYADKTASDRAVWLGVAASLAFVWLFIDQRRWSPHPVYAARLARTFSLTRCRLRSDGKVGPDSLPWRIPTTLSTWAVKVKNRPQLLLCAAAYDSVEQRADRLRAWPFVFTDRHVGGADVGWARTIDFEAVLGQVNQGDGTLQGAMAISGAALSPAIGRINLRSANSLVAAANVRLGVWLPSPRVIQAMRLKKDPVPSWVRIRRFSYLLKEIWGGYALDARLVYVTDGGQFDNLGLFELLGRRCETIFCFDASGDLKPRQPLNTRTFDDTRELARQRLGVVFSLPDQAPDGVRPGPDGPGQPVRPGALTSAFLRSVSQPPWTMTPCVPVAEDHVARLDIHYPDGSKGLLVYGKCVLTAGMEGSVAQEYAISDVGRARFPADSTVDQWLDDVQFDAYVDLGRAVGRRALARASEPASAPLAATARRPGGP